MARESALGRVRRKPTLAQVLIFYDIWLRDEAVGKAAHALDISENQMRTWMRKHPEFKLAKEMADERRGSRENFAGYIYKNLSPQAREIWDELQFWGESNTSADRIGYVLSGAPVKVRQELFIHALIHSNFNMSSACQLVQIPRALVERWRKHDLEFNELVEEIQWHKKNFFEEALISLVEERNPAATIFVNKTVNADRGYNEKLQVEHTGVIAHTGFQLEDLDLDVDTRRKLLDAIRNKKAALEQVQELADRDEEAIDV